MHSYHFDCYCERSRYKATLVKQDTILETRHLHNADINFVMSHCTTHSIQIICRGFKVGLADHMRSFYKQHVAIRYNVSDKYNL